MNTLLSVQKSFMEIILCIITPKQFSLATWKLTTILTTTNNYTTITSKLHLLLYSICSIYLKTFFTLNYSSEFDPMTVSLNSQNTLLYLSHKLVQNGNHHGCVCFCLFRLQSLHLQVNFGYFPPSLFFISLQQSSRMKKE